MLPTRMTLGLWYNAAYPRDAMHSTNPIFRIVASIQLLENTSQVAYIPVKRLEVTHES